MHFKVNMRRGNSNGIQFNVERRLESNAKDWEIWPQQDSWTTLEDRDFWTIEEWEKQEQKKSLFLTGHHSGIKLAGC